MAAPEADPSQPTNYSHPMFNELVQALRTEQEELDAEHRAERVERQQDAQDYAELLTQLSDVAEEVAVAASENPRLMRERVQFYRHTPKGARHVLHNRGDLNHTPAERGWVIVESGKPYSSSGDPNLFNKSGLGLALTEDGQLRFYVAQKGPHKRRTARTDIQHRGFVPKDHFRIPITGPTVQMPEQTWLPRSRTQDRPTLLLELEDPDNRLTTPRTIEQAYEALARFVQSEEL